jgi:SNF family Na+-dependent transporter
LLPSVLDTFITCLMMACDTHERTMIEAMVKAIVTEYSPSRPVAEPTAAPVAAATATPVATAPLATPHQRLGLIKKFVPFRI